MQRGFGVVVLVIVIFILLIAIGSGFWLGRMSLIPSGTMTLSTQNSLSSTPTTKFTKRSFDPNREIYPGRSLPAEVTNIAENNLVGFNCDGPYLANSDGQYLWQIQLDGETYLKPISSELYTEVMKVNSYLEGTNYQNKAAYITYCLTEKGGKYLLVGQPLPGGGAGSDTYIVDLNQGIGGSLEGLIKSEPWPYFGCSSILQISQEVIYIFCSAGDGGFSGQAVYKKSLANSEVIPVIRCTNTVQADTGQSRINCQ